MEDPKAWGEEARAVFAGARDPARLAAAVVRFHRTVDAVMDATVGGHALRLACSRGCSHCCHLRVAVQPHEAFALAAWIRRRFDPARLAAVLARLRENVARTKSLGVEGRKRANLACALLAADGTCSAYEARPAQCRRYHSTRLATCEAFHANPSDESLESPMHEALAHNAAVIITQAQHAVRAQELDAENADLNLALLEALENPKAWKRWKDGKKPFVGA
ncbi:MAG TPA: YkgJ family cysteine cluster protein [Usitatibacter sp.]|nr:YkgJ family cysteine cluster protein [Usitatibacter sp.]